ncbi:MAG: oxidoreductase [Planctomycetota bacterium]|jgi:NAD(P)H-quinone oxidoreductase subunit 5|nr:MAG: oxidoreductase [Planctomycetota bacterium]
MNATDQTVLHHVVALLVSWELMAPAVTLGCIGVPALIGRPLPERLTTRLVGAGFTTGFLAALATLTMLAQRGFAPEIVHLGTMFSVGHHAATVDLVADGLSIPYVCFTTGLCALVNAFAGKYLHREPGFTRFFILLTLFGTGMNLMVLAGSIDVLFAGWEFIGISSTLLIGFFHERRNAVNAALRAFGTYRICDVGLLTAGVVVHRAVGSGDFEQLFSGVWPDGRCLVPATTALIVSLLLVFAALGKSAQVPFSGWLPRAMEGPTPSSAIFYGALSIHAGAYLLLRCEPLLDAAPLSRWLLVAIGIGTALHAAVVGSVQTDLKSMLAYASMTQAGIILAEIGMGLRVVALVHVISHAILRSLQILRSPSAMHDRHELAAALGGHPGQSRWSLIRLLPDAVVRGLYQVALERGFEESVVQRWIVRPVVAVLEAASAAERRWVGFIGAEPAADVPPRPDRDGGAS